MRIGFIGLGMMGRGMAANIRRKGFSLTVMAHRSRAAVDALIAEGASEATTPAELAQVSDVVLICVTGSPQVEALIGGPDGILQTARPALVVVDCTTSQPASTRRLAAALADKGAAMVDAPVTRGPPDAEAGRLNSLVGGSDETIARIRPVLEAYSETIVHFGPIGAGHTAKLINNMITMGYAAVIAEAIGTAAAAGVDLAKLYRVISQGAAASGVLEKMLPKALEGDLTGHKFSIANALKDVGYYRNLADELGHAGTVSDALHQTYRLADNLGFGGRLMASLFEVQERVNGITVVPRPSPDETCGPISGAAEKS